MPDDLFSQLVKLQWLLVKSFPYIYTISSVQRLTFNQSLVNIRLIVIYTR